MSSYKDAKLKVVDGQSSKLPKVLVCYYIAQGLMDLQKLLYLESKQDLISISKVTLHGPLIWYPSAEPFERPLTYHTAIGDIAVDVIPAELKVHGLTFTSWA